MRILPMMGILVAASLPTARGAEDAKPKAAAHQSHALTQVEIEGDAAKPRAKRSTIVVRVGSDGKLEVRESLPGNVEKKLHGQVEKAAEGETQKPEARPRIQVKGVDIGGSVTVIGPDGVVHTHKLGTGEDADPDLQQLLGRALESAGAELPDDVAAQLRQSFGQQGRAVSAEETPAAAAVVERLDRILDKLETIERSLGRQKGSKKSRDRRD